MNSEGITPEEAMKKTKNWRKTNLLSWCFTKNALQELRVQHPDGVRFYLANNNKDETPHLIAVGVKLDKNGMKQDNNKVYRDQVSDNDKIFATECTSSTLNEQNCCDTHSPLFTGKLDQEKLNKLPEHEINVIERSVKATTSWRENVTRRTPTNTNMDFIKAWLFGDSSEDSKATGWKKWLSEKPHLFEQVRLYLATKLVDGQEQDTLLAVKVNKQGQDLIFSDKEGEEKKYDMSALFTTTTGNADPVLNFADPCPSICDDQSPLNKIDTNKS